MSGFFRFGYPYFVITEVDIDGWRGLKLVAVERFRLLRLWS